MNVSCYASIVRESCHCLWVVSHVTHMNVSSYAYTQALSELIILTASRCLMGKEIRNELFAEVSGSHYIFFFPFSLYYLNGFALCDGQGNP